MKSKAPRIYISAAHKSSGKTTLSIGLCAALRKRGHIVQPFKKGPDYIDPLWLTTASGRSCHNLDFNTMTNDEILATVHRYSDAADISVIEGNKGLYDGLALDGSDSNAATAILTDSPVILVLDTRGVTRGVAPLLLGYQEFDPEINIAGVIFNLSAGGRHEKKLRTITEHYTDIPVLGVVKKNPALELTERHLGLMPSNENATARQQISEIGNIVDAQVDLELFINIANKAKPLPVPSDPVEISTQDYSEGKIRLGICRDSSFGFYYPGDLQELEKAGATLVNIDTLNDKNLPPIDGLFIGGGFPETHMEKLSANHSLQADIKKAIDNGLPTYAECGGLMYLSRNIIWGENKAPMVGVIPGDVVMHDKPQGRGYVKLVETEDMPWPDRQQDKVISAHEFHYSQLENLTETGCFAYRMTRGLGINGEYDGWLYKNLLASYTHMRDTSNNHWARRFIKFIRACSC
jgi:cobyrinic acid a,c-diamide synthase